MSFLRLTLSALEGRECIYGQDHPDTIASMIYVAIHRRDQDEQEKMAEVVARALPTVRKLAEKKKNVDKVNTGASLSLDFGIERRGRRVLKSTLSDPSSPKKWEGATGDLVQMIKMLIQINLKQGRVYQAADMEGILFQLLSRNTELD